MYWAAREDGMIETRALGVLFVVVIAGLSQACATGPKYREVENQLAPINSTEGRVFFYRESQIIGSAIWPPIILDGEIVGKGIPGGFFFVDLRSGEHTVGQAAEGVLGTLGFGEGYGDEIEGVSKRTFTLSPGETKFIQLRPTPTGPYASGYLRTIVVDPEYGLAAIKKLRFTGKRK